jgi:hypothetical protein
VPVRLGVNVPNFGLGTNPDVLRRCALTVEGLGFDLLMMSDHLCSLGAGTVVLDPFNGDHQETAHPETAWQALASVAERWNQQESKDTDPERS